MVQTTEKMDKEIIEMSKCNIKTEVMKMSVWMDGKELE